MHLNIRADKTPHAAAILIKSYCSQYDGNRCAVGRGCITNCTLTCYHLIWATFHIVYEPKVARAHGVVTNQYNVFQRERSVLDEFTYQETVDKLAPLVKSYGGLVDGNTLAV